MGLSKFEQFVLDTVVESSEQQHRFSLSYKVRKRKMIRDYEKSFVSIAKTRHFRLKYLLIAVISAGIAVLAGFGVYSMIEGFRVTDYDTHSLLYIVDDYETGKTRIEKKFCIGLDMTDYEVETVCDEDVGYWLSYKKGEKNNEKCIGKGIWNQQILIFKRIKRGKIMKKLLALLCVTCLLCSCAETNVQSDIEAAGEVTTTFSLT